MSANASPRALRYAVLSSTLGEFCDYQLEMDCGAASCRRDRRYAISQLAGFYGKAVTMSQIVNKLRCQECDGRAMSVVLLRPIGERKPVLVRVPLVGPQARD
jgi:hypothetical protein